jgi:iron complex outermembrane receptor protein/vitamin B12 transporter
MSLVRRFLKIGLFALLSVLFALPVAAQQPATVGGAVMDPLGARVAGATVALTGGSQSRDTRSGADGAYTFADVAPGLYQIVVSQQGFQPSSSAPVYIAAGARQTIDVTLQVSPLQQSVLVTAAATEISQAQTGAPVTVLDSATLDALNKQDVLEALRLVPGAQVVQTGARGGPTSMFIRGGNANFNKVLIDGAVANDIGGGFDFSQMATAGVDRVEVMRQTNSVIYGSDALAGVISITTKRGRTRLPEFTYAADGGNFRTWTSEAGIGGVVKRFDYYSSYRVFETDNDVPNNGYSNGTYAGRFGVALGTKADLSGTIRRTDAESGSPNAVTLFGLADDSEQSTDLTYASIAANSQFTDRLQATVRFGSTDQRSRFTNPTPTGQPFDPFGFGANYLGNTVTLTGANGYSVTGRGILDFDSSYPTFFESHTTRRALSGQATFMISDMLSVSGGGRFEREEGASCSSAAGCLDNEATTPVTGRNNGGAFAEARATLMNRHYIAAGVGIEHNEVFGEEVTPRLSVASYLRQPSATGSGDTKIVLNAGTGIKAPAIFQAQSSLFELVRDTPAGAGVDPIGPERSRSFDIGIEQGFADNRARVRVAYFHNTFHDLIEFLSRTSLPLVGVPAAVANATQFGAYVNSQSYRAQGLELSFEEAPRADLRVMASYTRLDAEVTEAFSASRSFNTASTFATIPIGAFSPLVGARPFRRPANSGTLAVIYSPRRYQVALSAYFSGTRDDSTFMSDQFFGSSMLLPNEDLADAYQKVDVSGAVDLHRRLKVYASIENLLDQEYEASFGFPALPLAARVGFRLTVGGN